jgi:hypothetical protein
MDHSASFTLWPQRRERRVTCPEGRKGAMTMPMLECRSRRSLSQTMEFHLLPLPVALRAISLLAAGLDHQGRSLQTGFGPQVVLRNTSQLREGVRAGGI